MNREECLDEAKKNTTGQRQQDYGSPEDNFGRIAKLWSAYDGRVSFTAVDVAMMLALLKVARVKGSILHFDNYVDLAGYAACAAEIASEAVKLDYGTAKITDPAELARIFREES